jgi:phosphoribosyl-ATP pyrophosphohydrolase
MNNDKVFEVQRVSNDISFNDFYENYFEPEIPVIIENVSTDWLATTKWNQDYLKNELSKEKTIKDADLWYHCLLGFLKNDYEVPHVIQELLTHSNIFPRKDCLRIWINSKGNISDWHYDTNMVNVFNVQVKGEKNWKIISPNTPLECYPFSHIGVLKSDEKVLKNKPFASFTTKQGDMIYLPPLWYHKVVAVGEENININWVVTKKSTSVISESFKREVEITALNELITQKKPLIFSFLYNLWIETLKPFAHITWIFDEDIKSDYAQHKLMKRFLSEIKMFSRTILDARKLLKSKSKLEKTAPEIKKERLDY